MGLSRYIQRQTDCLIGQCRSNPRISVFFPSIKRYRAGFTEHQPLVWLQSETPRATRRKKVITSTVCFLKEKTKIPLKEERGRRCRFQNIRLSKSKVLISYHHIANICFTTCSNNHLLHRHENLQVCSFDTVE